MKQVTLFWQHHTELEIIYIMWQDMSFHISILDGHITNLLRHVLSNLHTEVIWWLNLQAYMNK